MTLLRILTALLLGLVITTDSALAACPAGQIINARGFCEQPCPACDVTPTPEVAFAGPALENWIDAVHDRLMPNAQPIPPYIRKQLTGYVDPALLDLVRYRVANAAMINPGGLGLQLDIYAVTLKDLIVFQDPNEACCNAALWAHELFHAAQYKNWGVHQFALQYVRDYRQIEDPAYAVQHAYGAWKNSQPQLTLPAGYGEFCLIGERRYGPIAVAPVGSHCTWHAGEGDLTGTVIE